MPRDFVQENEVSVRPQVPAPIPPVLKAPPATDAVLDVLAKAREWLSDPAHWCKGHYERDGGTCAWGATMKAGGSEPFRETPATQGADAVLKKIVWDDGGFGAVSIFNDAPTTTHADVLALFDRAIAQRKAEIGSA